MIQAGVQPSLSSSTSCYSTSSSDTALCVQKVLLHRMYFGATASAVGPPISSSEACHAAGLRRQVYGSSNIPGNANITITITITPEHESTSSPLQSERAVGTACDIVHTLQIISAVPLINTKYSSSSKYEILHMYYTQSGIIHTRYM